MFKNIKKNITILLCFFISACNKEELNIYPKTNITEGNFYKNETQLIQAVNDIYRHMGIIYGAEGIVDLYGELRSDNTYIKHTTGLRQVSIDINNFSIKTDNFLIANAWQELYSAIFTCNNAIEQLNKTEVIFKDPKLKERLKSEVIFVRALIYFNIVRVWGDAPLALSVVTPDESYNFLREKKEIIYKQIIDDLIYCKNILPEKYTGVDVGRVTKYGAEAVLAKAYLTINDKINSEKELRSIVNSNLYSLDANNDGIINVEDYLFIFKPDTKNCKASVLEVQYKAGTNAVNNNHQITYMPWHFAFHLPGSTENLLGTGLNTPSDDLDEEFELDDPRKAASINPGFIDLSTNQFISYPWTPKFYDPNWRNAGQNFEIIRYADILLMLSEVTNNPTYLNMVRARAGLPGFGEAGYPARYNTLDLAIEHERRVELCFEFHRFFDLVRTGRAIDVMQTKGYNLNADKLLFPIPLRTIDINPKIIQNSGY